MMFGAQFVTILTLVCLTSSLSLSRPSNVKPPKKPDEVVKLDNQDESGKQPAAQSSNNSNKKEPEPQFVIVVGPDGQEFEYEVDPNAPLPTSNPSSEVDKENPEDPDSTTTEPPIGIPLGGIASLVGGGTG